MQIQGTAETQPFSHGRRMHPEPMTVLGAFQGHRRQRRGLGPLPGLQQQGGQGRQVVPLLGIEGLEGCLGARGPLPQAMFGEQQIQIRLGAGVDRQAADHVPLSRQLAHGIAVDLHLHHRFALGCEVLGVAGRQCHGGQQPVVEGNRHQALVLLLHLRQQAGGAALENALNATLGGAAAASLAGHAHQHPIPVPGVVQLVVADVDVLVAVFPQGEAEALAAAAQPRLDQALVVYPADAVVGFPQHAHSHQPGEGDPQLLFIGFCREPEGLFQFGDAELLLGGELLDQVGDRELHGGGRRQVTQSAGLGLRRSGTPLDCALDPRGTGRPTPRAWNQAPEL